MDIRTISGAAYSRPAAPIAGGDVSLPAEATKPADSAAPFFSPVYRFDPVAKLSILSFRDANSGAVVQQIPNEKVVEQYRRTGGESPDARPVATAAERPAAPSAGVSARSASAPDTTEPAPGASSAPEKAAPAPVVTAAPEPAAPTPAAAPEAPPVQRVSLSV